MTSAAVEHPHPGPATATASGGPVDLDGRRLYRITAYDQMPPFFMTLVGASDLWVFISSTGGLTAGRVAADHALFPYYTEDKVSEGAGRTGGLTVLRVPGGDGTTTVWQPFAETRPGDPAVERNLYKDYLGTTLIFEERRPDLDLTLRVAWETSARYGVVRTCELAGTGATPRTVDVLDGFVNLLPAGATVQVQNELSYLLDAYKRAEVEPGTGLGLFYLNSGLTDLAEPRESLHATVAWQVGLDGAEHLLSTQQVHAFGLGGPVAPENDVRGRRGAYLVRSGVVVPPGGTARWHVVADVEQSAADVVALGEELRQPHELAARLRADVEQSRTDLAALVATADGAQLTGDELAAAHHSANVLFNVMRGGVPADGYLLDAADVRRFVAHRSTLVASRCTELLAGLPERVEAAELVARARTSGDPDLERLALEYLPLTFSRRHGDPSRPWNTFRIALRDADGGTRVDYQGNWRDIFQNWEALAWSFPEYAESMVTVFLDATTADGYNPYRISRDGIDWEVPEPGNPWANIGYWSDHQIVYLSKLLETSMRFHPGRLHDLAVRRLFTHADVPYRIATYSQTLDDPYSTITFDDEAHAATLERAAAEGSDGRLLHGLDGDLVRVTLAEKLLLPLLAKLVNLVPDGGIWMNTQRPEWNDANNALVGRGLSVVTLAYLRRFLGVVRDLLGDDVELTTELATLLARVRGVLAAHAGAAASGLDDAERREVMDELGAAGTAYRARVYDGLSGERVTVPASTVAELLDLAQQYVDTGLRANRREDGLYHSYNVLDLAPGRAGVRRLQEMLEGQVAILSSGLLTPDEAADLLTALRRSALYRADQHSYLLYPDRVLPRFLERNTVTGEQAAACPLLDQLVASGDRTVVLRDVRGDLHFAPGIRNARDLVEALDDVAPRLPAGAVDQGRGALLHLFDDVFRHSEFTGRSGSFFAFEGLGSIYWHMVSKLLLAVQENVERAAAEGADAALVSRLVQAYDDVRRGLGYCKEPARYGAFPVDPYSHTPAGRGARQPGMTGQVKEEVLTRLGELGLRVEAGRIVVRPLLLRGAEWTTGAATFTYRDVAGGDAAIPLEPGSLAFTFCQVPVVYRRVGPGEPLTATAVLADGTRVPCPGGALDEGTSARVFRRTGEVVRLEVDVPTAGA